MNKQKIMRRA